MIDAKKYLKESDGLMSYLNSRKLKTVEAKMILNDALDRIRHQMAMETRSKNEMPK